MNPLGDMVTAMRETLGRTYERGARRNVDVEVSIAEAQLHHALNTLGIPHVQQHPVGPYDADFFMVQSGLCVEVDGRLHDITHDRRRDAYFAERDIVTLRYTAREVFQDARACALDIAARLVWVRRLGYRQLLLERAIAARQAWRG